jgi:hypothetical protein
VEFKKTFRTLTHASDKDGMGRGGMDVRISGASTSGIAVAFKYDERIINAIKALKGRWYNWDAQVWILPDSHDMAQNLLQTLWKTGLFDYHSGTETVRVAAPARFPDDVQLEPLIEPLTKCPVERPDGKSSDQPGAIQRLLERYRERIRAVHYSPMTERAYSHWLELYARMGSVPRPGEPAEARINAFLTMLAVKQNVSASTQNQALAAILFLYRQVFGTEVG